MFRVPGPTSSSVLFELLLGGRTILDILTKLERSYGPVARLGSGESAPYLVSDPELIRQILVTDAGHFAKDRAWNAARAVIGNGLLTSEGKFHLEQRRLAGPAFARSRLEDYSRVVLDCVERRMESWRPGQSVDLSRDMMHLTLDIVARAVFGGDIGAHLEPVGRALKVISGQFSPARAGFLPLLMKLPLPGTLRFRSAARLLKALMDELIGRRRCPEDTGHSDLLALLLASGMSDRQLRDECLTLFLAGHETTSDSLSWIFFLLSRYPEALAKLRHELQEVVGRRPVAYEDLPALTYADQLLREAWRMYPPAWTIARRNLVPLHLGLYRIAAHSTLLMSQWVMHRHPRFFPEPERFWPERWTSEFTHSLPRFAYFPFGGGTRVCIAESFSRMEILLVLTRIIQNWTFEVRPGLRVRPQCLITLRPRGGLPGRWLRAGQEG